MRTSFANRLPAFLLLLLPLLPAAARGETPAGDGAFPPGLRLEAGARAGYPHGAGAAVRLTAWLYVLEAGCDYAPALSGCRLGSGVRFAFWGPNALSLLGAHEWVLHETRSEEIERGFHLEVEYARDLGRSGWSVSARAGGAFHPHVAGDVGEMLARPSAGIGLRKRLLGR